MARPFAFEITNGFKRPITINANDRDEIFTDLSIVLQQIDIPYMGWEDTYWVKPGEWAILVPSKND